VVTIPLGPESGRLATKRMRWLVHWTVGEGDTFWLRFAGNESSCPGTQCAGYTLEKGHTTTWTN